MPKKEFSEEAIPSFDQAPSVVAVVGDLPFFVEEAAERARGRLADGDVEVLRFDDEASPGSVAEALLNRSLFSPRRLVEIDLSRVLGADEGATLVSALRLLLTRPHDGLVALVTVAAPRKAPTSSRRSRGKVSFSKFAWGRSGRRSRACCSASRLILEIAPGRRNEPLLDVGEKAGGDA